MGPSPFRAGTVRIDRSRCIPDLYLQISGTVQRKNNHRQALSCFVALYGATGSIRLVAHKGPTVGPESHPAFGVYLTNKARRAYLFAVWHHRRDHYPERSPSALRRARVTARCQRKSRFDHSQQPLHERFLAAHASRMWIRIRLVLVIRICMIITTETSKIKIKPIFIDFLFDQEICCQVTKYNDLIVIRKIYYNT